ncbi:uncharacterized [Tachysurus ichikawai]
MQCLTDPRNLAHYLVHCAALLPLPHSHPVTERLALPQAWPAISCLFSPVASRGKGGPCFVFPSPLFTRPAGDFLSHVTETGTA